MLLLSETTVTTAVKALMTHRHGMHDVDKSLVPERTFLGLPPPGPVGLNPRETPIIEQMDLLLMARIFLV